MRMRNGRLVTINGFNNSFSWTQFFGYLKLLLSLAVSIYFTHKAPKIEYEILYYLSLSIVVVTGYLVQKIDPTDPISIKEAQSKLDKVPFDDTQYEFFCTNCDVHCLKDSKHCRKCNRCVEGFDHHCEWLNNCIGKKNYRVFIVMVASLLFNSLVFISRNIHFYVEMRDYRSSIKRLVYGLTLPNLFGEFLMMIMNVNLIVFHIYLYRLNITSYEFFTEQMKNEEMADHAIIREALKQSQSRQSQLQHPQQSTQLESMRSQVIDYDQISTQRRLSRSRKRFNSLEVFLLCCKIIETRQFATVYPQTQQIPNQVMNLADQIQYSREVSDSPKNGAEFEGSRQSQRSQNQDQIEQIQSVRGQMQHECSRDENYEQDSSGSSGQAPKKRSRTFHKSRTKITNPKAQNSSVSQSIDKYRLNELEEKQDNLQKIEDFLNNQIVYEEPNLKLKTHHHHFLLDKDVISPIKLKIQAYTVI